MVACDNVYFDTETTTLANYDGHKIFRDKKVISVHMQNSSVVEASRSLHHIYERKNNIGKKSERKESKNIEN